MSGTANTGKVGAQTNRAQAEAFAVGVLPIIKGFQREGLSLRGIVEKLNAGRRVSLRGC